MADSILRWFNEVTIIGQLSMLAQRWKDHVGRWIQAVITKAAPRSTNFSEKDFISSTRSPVSA
jgi:hypothetical protein